MGGVPMKQITKINFEGLDNENIYKGLEFLSAFYCRFNDNFDLEFYRNDGITEYCLETLSGDYGENYVRFNDVLFCIDDNNIYNEYVLRPPQTATCYN